MAKPNAFSEHVTPQIRSGARGPRLARGRAAAGQPMELDRLIHERIRLGILSALAVNDPISFNDLKKLLKTTDGNLSVHARKLEEAGYIACTKSFSGRVPRKVMTFIQYSPGEKR